METQTDLPLGLVSKRPEQKPAFIEGSSPGCKLKRPHQRDEGIIRAAAQLVAQDCLRWDPKSDVDDWVRDLMKAKYEWDDGYTLAKYLDDHCHVSSDRELVEILDGATSKLREVHNAEVKKWVGIVGFKPEHAIGAAVSTRHGEGRITGIYVETAQYVVNTEGKKEGGYIINAEDLIP